MKANRFTEEQIVRALKEVEMGGKKAVDQQRELGISAATWYIWKRKYGGLEVNEASDWVPRSVPFKKLSLTMLKCAIA